MNRRLSVCRSCPAEVVWTITAGGKRMPVDANPSDRGDLELVDEVSGVVRSTYVPEEEREGRDDLHLSHFATCPQAGQWRERRAS